MSLFQAYARIEYKYLFTEFEYEPRMCSYLNLEPVSIELEHQHQKKYK